MTVPTKAIAPPDHIAVRRALISVHDKSGLAEFAGALQDRGIELVSTGGTAEAIKAAGVAVRDVSDLTGFPEILDGRVKTLHPVIHAGLLAIRGDEAHRAALEAHDIGEIDLVVVSLYPFEAVVAGGADDALIVENIDIGGPAMIRAAAKNFAYVGVATSPEDYALVLRALEEGDGSLTLAMRRELSAKAFARTAAYDGAVSRWFAAGQDNEAPAWRSLSGKLKLALRYGENPHQSAAFYTNEEPGHGVAEATLLQGKPLSYNNINDTDAAFELVSEFDPGKDAAVAIIKHANPCGVALGADPLEAYRRALACDPTSAFGGIVALNTPLDLAVAKEIAQIFTEVIIAPGIDDDAAAFLETKKNLRVLVTGGLADASAGGAVFKSVRGGFLVQSRDNRVVDDLELDVVTARKPTEAELRDLRLAFQIVKHVKSNAMVFVRDQRTIGIGAGQMSRVDASHLGVRKAEEAGRSAGSREHPTKGCVVASDAFFPFADGLEVAAEAGATAVIQPGGSRRDDEVIAAADAAGMAMVMTGTRHFRH